MITKYSCRYYDKWSSNRPKHVFIPSINHAFWVVINFAGKGFLLMLRIETCNQLSAHFQAWDTTPMLNGNEPKTYGFPEEII